MFFILFLQKIPKGSLQKKVCHLSPREGGGQRGFVTNKKNSQNDFWAILSIFGVFSFSPFLGGSNPKAGGWILDFARDVVISRGSLLPSMIWQCAQGG